MIYVLIVKQHWEVRQGFDSGQTTLLYKKDQDESI